MKEEWKLEKLGNVCNFVRGPFGGSLKKSSFKPTGIAVYEQRHAIYNQFDEIRYFIDDEKFEEMKRFELEPGDLIMSCSGTMGKVAVVPENVRKGIINQALLKLTPSAELNVKYLQYWMNSPNFQESLARSTVGAAIKNVASVKVLKEIQIYLPNIHTQKLVVDKLDDAFDTIGGMQTDIEKNILNAEELFQSNLNKVFNNDAKVWEIKYLYEICENLDRKRKPITKNKRVSGDIPYYGASGIVDYIEDYIFDENLLLVSEDGANLLARKYPIAFSVSGKTWVNNHAHVLKFKSQITQKFVEYYLNAIRLDDYISGMAQPKLNQAKLNTISIPYPSIQRQDEIINTLTDLRNLQNATIRNLKRKITLLDELKKSILQKAFVGELLKDSPK